MRKIRKEYIKDSLLIHAYLIILLLASAEFVGGDATCFLGVFLPWLKFIPGSIH